ncbi:MAG: protein-L-isoaspartate(D-aspartate) O-methyltransferase [Opitutaceae bacterium]|nr:protein-L-isoaspartate(D-aspartate) O-methyltransferase [Opitutaceae bacterium]
MRALLSMALASVTAVPIDAAEPRAGPEDELRRRMVNAQIVARGVKDELTLAAVRKVPRHLFVPEDVRRDAYEDSPLPIGHGQTISQPYIVAFTTEAARITRKSKVLEIGTGSGYQAAIAAELSDHVFSIEIVPELAERARAILRATGYERVTVRTGDGYQGWPEHAPFDVIIVTAAPEAIPPPLLAQLAEGGRMVIPVGSQTGMQYLLLVTKHDGQVRAERLMPVRFVPFTREKPKR